MDRVYEGNETGSFTSDLEFTPVIPPNSGRLNPWKKELYKQRNEAKRLFRRLKRFRRVCTRFDNLNVIFLAFVVFALIVDALKNSVNIP